MEKQIQIVGQQSKKYHIQHDIHALKDPDIKDAFTKHVEQSIHSKMQNATWNDANAYQQTWEVAFREAARATLPKIQQQKSISEGEHN